MKKMLTAMMVVFVLSFALVSAQDEEATKEYTFWIGGHYTDFTDYNKKVGEYNLGNEDFIPEFKGSYRFRSGEYLLNIDGHYYDEYNIAANYSQRWADRIKGDIYYRSLVWQEGQDLLVNLSAREEVLDEEGNPVPGGKMLTHELQDEGADYETHRKEFGGRAEVLLSRKHNVRMMAAHRSIIKTGEEQKIASGHCFSCHVVSKSAEIDRRTDEFEIGLQADVNDFTFGYKFGYRNFNSDANDPNAYYDAARHPVRGDAGAEFSSRQIFSDTTAVFGTYPSTRKFSHKVRAKGDVGKGRFAGSVSYSTTENRNTDLGSTSWSGVAQYAMPLNKKTRMIARVRGVRYKTDDPFIDLPLYRDGRPGPTTNFDFIRYSSLDRNDIKGSVEILSRLNLKTTVSGLLGYNVIDRHDYPLADGDDQQTGKFFGQVKFKYRNGLKFSFNAKYRMEMISDPFTSGRGLFEAPGRGVIGPESGTSFVFYWQREELRYQDITTYPTDVHEFDFKTTYRPDNKMSIIAGLKGKYDKNGDLDSLDVEHFSYQPNLVISLTPDPKWAMSAGYTFGHYKSRGPVTVALFDG